MAPEQIRLLVESVSIAENLIADTSHEERTIRRVMVHRYWEAYSHLVCALMRDGRLYEALVYSERAKALAHLPELNLPPPPIREEEAMLTLMNMIESLPDDSAILTYFIGEEEAFAWVIRKGMVWILGKRVPWVRGGTITPRIGEKPAVSLLETLAKEGFRRRFDPAKEPDHWIVGAGRDMTIKGFFDWFRAREVTDVDTISRLFDQVGVSNQVGTSVTLYQILFQRAEPALQDVRTITVIPDGFLHYVPFEALIKGEAVGDYSEPTTPTTDTNFLVKDYAFSYIPSLLSFGNVPKQAETQERMGSQFVGFGNPTFVRPGEAVYRDRCFDSIPSTEEEVKVIAEMFSEQGKAKHSIPKVFLRHDATKAHFLRESPFASHLHVATHGVAFDEDVEDSALIFSSCRNSVPFEADAVLKCRDIGNLKLNADLVVVSACRSGLGSYRRGEGMQGLAQAFISAGAKSVILSLWNIADKETTIFMTHFYRALLSGMPAPEACCFAKKEMIKIWPDPFYWAGFLLQKGKM